jgi:membrane protein YdbS with pleckstrin-like domain
MPHVSLFREMRFLISVRIMNYLLYICISDLHLHLIGIVALCVYAIITALIVIPI